MALPSLSTASAPWETFHKTHPEYPQDLAVGSIIIYQPPTSNEPLALVLRRVPSDSFGGKWDLPGGGVDKVPDVKRHGSSAVADPSLVSACKREVLEETGLHVSKVVDLIFYHEWQDEKWMTQLKNGLKGLLTNTRRKADETREGWTGKFTFLVEVEEIQGRAQDQAGAEVVVKLSETEHDAYRWITEAEAEESLKKGGDDFISREDLESFKVAFEKWRTINN